MVSQGSSVASDGLPGYMQSADCPGDPESGFSSPDLALGVGVYAKLSKESLKILGKKAELGLGCPPKSILKVLASSSGGIPVEISDESSVSEHTPTPEEAILASLLEDSRLPNRISQLGWVLGFRIEEVNRWFKCPFRKTLKGLMCSRP